MDPTTLLPILAIALMIITAMWVVLSPLFQNANYTTAEIPSYETQELTDLEHQRDALYSNIKNLKFDLETNKISNEDYQRERAKLTKEAAAVLKEIDIRAGDLDTQREALIDRLLTEATPTDDDAEGHDLVKADIARIAAGHTNARRTAACPQCQSAVSPNDQFCSHCGQGLAVKCPDCGHPIAADDHFCANCGAQLVLEKAL